MTTRQRSTSTMFHSDRSRTAGLKRNPATRLDRRRKRQNLLEALETRQLLAGPQLIGIQPNEGDLIVDGTVRNVAPRVLTLRFDQDQQIDPATFDGIRVSRAGNDGLLGSEDDIVINAGLVTLGDSAANEVVVRFSDALPDDDYRVEVFGFDDPALGITGLRNVQGELLQPRTAGQRLESTTFKLRLGAQIEAVVPQPVVRLPDGTLVQNRNEIVVYFNEDPLFVENDGSGNPTERSAENPRFYQLFLTNETVRTTDDALYHPDQVIYDAATHTARLIFADDINDLGPDDDGNPGVPLAGGTFRLRIGTAVDDRVDIVLPPVQTPVAPSASSDFGIAGLKVEFVSKAVGELASGTEVHFIDSGAGGLTVTSPAAGVIEYDLGGGNPSVASLRAVTESNPAVDALISVRFSLAGVPGTGGATVVPDRVVGSQPLVLHAVGDTLATALDVGVFGDAQGLTSLVFSEAIDPQPLAIELLGGNDDPGRPEVQEILDGGLGQYINEVFGLDGADVTDGITEVAYNFNGIYFTSGSQSFVNEISPTQKARVREALNTWESVLGIQFRETVDEGITFAVGNPAVLPNSPGTLQLPAYRAALTIDPTFQDSILVFDSAANFATNYGEQFFRLTTAGIGLLIGLEQAPNLPPQTLMSSPTGGPEPIFPGNYDILHGQHLYRPDGNDVDLYRFEVDLGDADQLGTLTAETFAERLADSSLLDTTLTLFQETFASAETDLGIGSALSVRFDSLESGRHGNNTKIEFFRSDRVGSNDEIRITQPLDSSGQPVANAILVDIPRRSSAIPTVTVGAVIDAINNDPFASGLLRASLVRGEATTDISGPSLNLLPVRLRGGGIERLSRNDDYFSEDSRLIANLGAGVYYIGVAASGNETYDPTTTASGYGGVTQGAYDLHLKFEPQVDEVDVLRDLDSDRADVPGTPLDGDADGRPGGAHNFWFQTRPINRQINFTVDGTAIVPRQTITVTGFNGVVRTFEFVPIGSSASAGNIPVVYNDGSSGVATPAELIARELRNAINSRSSETGVQATRVGALLELTGERMIELSNNFRGGDVIGRNIFVDKTASPLADGSLSRPFENIANSNVPNAFDAAMPGDIVRIVGNGGQDGLIETAADNFSYQFGVADTGGQVLDDGRNMEVPRGVTTMIDAGAILKFRSSRIGVGSSNLLDDRSGGALQVLGTPRLVQLSVSGDPVAPTLVSQFDGSAPDYSAGSVILTSIKDRNADADAAGSSTAAAPGDWGGIVFRRDVDRAEGRVDLEDEGIFLQQVNHAQIRYGGGSNVLIDSIQQLVNPIQVFELRPSVTFNEISFSADAAISASPDSFEETSYQSPRFQQGGAFTADYSRVGPEIHDNQLFDNSINGLFVRVDTTPNQPPKLLTTSGRFDDVDVVHYFAENIVIQGTPGGSIQDGVMPVLISTSLDSIAGGGLDAGTYDYRMTFVDASGFESLASDPSPAIVTGDNTSIRLANLPQVPGQTDYLSRRLYRLDPASGDYLLIASLDATDTTYLDDGTVSQGVLDLTRTGVRARLDASLVIDPGMVLKFRGSRLQMGIGTHLIAEGTDAEPIVFTSFADDRFGSGGTFDTNNDSDSPSGVTPAVPGDWSGLYAGPTSTLSIDHATVAYGGGISLLQGGQARGFAAIELQQADGRIANSNFEFNQNAQAGSGPASRFGLLSTTDATIFVRGNEPVIVGNTFTNNNGNIIDIDADSLGGDLRLDHGRQTGAIDRFSEFDDNYGPLIRLNRYVENDPGVNGNQIAGLTIRGGVVLTTPSVWDDTDIVHLLDSSIAVNNVHSEGGLRLQSRSNESLVVKFTGPGTAYDDRIGTGLIATGTLGNAADRIGGSLQIIGSPGFPVVLTSFQDDTVGAGLTPEGTAFTDNNGDGIGSRPAPNDWRGILLEQYSNDRNVDFIPEQTITNEVAPGLNGSVVNAQVLGALARDTLSGNDQFRLGFEVEGLISADNDVDTYSFTAEAGTQIWIDIDRTSLTLDTVVEILDADGNVLARSDNSFDEIAGRPLQDVDPGLVAGSLPFGATTSDDFGVGGLYKDYGSTNPRDAGLRLFLPGAAGVRSVYFFRVRSASINPDDTAGGITHGVYRFQVRLQEEQEFSGNVLRYTDIRYANHGIYARGQGDSSPFLGDAQEDENLPSDGIRPDIINDTVTFDPLFPNVRAQYIGNLLQSEDKTFSIGGALANADDVDFYQIDVSATSQGLLQTSTVFDIDYADGITGRPDTSLVVFYDRDGEDGALPPELVLIAEDSNILDDQGKPLTSENIDLLTRGSISTGDPFIGPVSLSEGTYFVGVAARGAVATALANIGTRREPIESILRIFEDHVEQLGGNTALPPREDAFVDPAATSPGWSTTTDRALNVGHGITDTFNYSRNNYSQQSVQGEIEGSNNTFVNAQDLDASEPIWSLGADGNIGDQFQNTSIRIPHTTVNGSLRNDVVDVFQFTVDVDNSFVILDVDNGFDPELAFNDPTNVDTQLLLFDSSFNQLDGNFDSLVTDGAGGSVASFDNPDPLLPSLSRDPYLDGFLDAGTYFVAVTRESTIYEPLTQSFFGFSTNRGDYQLHVSIENHANNFGNPNNESYFFDRSEATGVLQSNPFDLTGYDAADLPRFYFNYFYNPGGTPDNVTVSVSSDSTGGFVDLADVDLVPADFLTANQWRQGVASLADFAGHTNVVIQFSYETVGSSPLAEGLYLDDFVVGFAERGEMITSAGFDDLGVVGGSAAAGEYQLEIRSGSEHAEARLQGSAIQMDLTTSFDTNDRQTDGTATIIAPHPDQIADTDTFVLSDGIRSVRFEFDLGGGVTPGNIRVDVAGATDRVQVADAIRTAINLPGVQSTISIQAADVGGNANGGIGSELVVLAGTVVGDFLVLDAPADLPASGQPLNPGGTFLLPVSFSSGTGDVNTTRSQTQLILDSNRISDAYAIGIWSRYGERVQDPQDDIVFDQDSIYVLVTPPARDDEDWLGDPDARIGFGPPNFPVNHDTPRLGPSSPGAVRNLPTLNNSLVGGITPGVVLVNNTIDQAGYAGIKIDGQSSPLVIDSFFTDFYRVEEDPEEFVNAELGRLIPDGLTMAIHSAGERVVFEFEDISGGGIGTAGVITGGGSGVAGGDGWQDGHVPIFYRQSDNAYTVTGYGIGGITRGAAYTRTEVMWSIYQAILGSPLVTNGLVELVEPSIGPSHHYADFDPFTTVGERIEQPAVYVEGASAISFSAGFQKVGYDSPFVEHIDADPDQHIQAAVHEPPQSFPRVINNTIYGRDGLASQYRELGTIEPSDLPDQAIDTRQGGDAGPVYQSVGEINTPADVDFYEVELGLGDRLTIDVDTLPGGADTYVRVFDTNGLQVAANDVAPAPDHLNGVLAPPIIPDPPVGVDPALEVSEIDPFVDFTATVPGTYFVAVSSEGNNTYDPLTLSGRLDGSGGTGFYGLTINVDAPRTFTFNFDAGTQTTDFSALLGTTITVTHVNDVAVGRNTTTYEFVADDGVGAPEQPLDPNNVPIPLFSPAATRVPDVLRRISLTMRDPDLDPATDTESVLAYALGGEEALGGDLANRGLRGQNVGLTSWSWANRDWQGFGHDRDATITSSPSPQRATTETFVFALGIANLELSPEAVAAGLNLGPYAGSNAQGGIPEAGLVTSNGTSATVVNNLFVNLDQSIVQDHIDFAVYGRGGPHPKQSLVIVTGNISQSDTNGSIPNDNFNVNLPPQQILFENADGNNFLPDQASYAIDSAINSIIDREDIRSLRASLGLPDSNIVAPDRDVNGVLRADNPLVAPPGGLGGAVFKDRGSTELADFVGPVAIANVPLDNDAEGIDLDAANSFIRVREGVFEEFRIQLRDTGDASDPFAGQGIDDNTVVVPEIPGLRDRGANVTLFENERLLTEGIDYSFSYDTTQNVITLTPIAGTWKSDRSYRIELNNRDRTVLIAPAANEVRDGDSLQITDDNGGTLVFEIESGYSLVLPEPITLAVPRLGTNTGGLRDGDFFQLDDGTNPPVIFEFDLDGTRLPNSVVISLPAGPTPNDPDALQLFLNGIAEDVREAIQGQVDDGRIDVDVRRIDHQVIVGTNPGARAITTGSGLEQLARTLALVVPENLNLYQEGDSFTLSNGVISQTFEGDVDTVLQNPDAVPINLLNISTPEEAALAIADAIAGSDLRLSPSIADDGRTVFLNLPAAGSVSDISAPLTLVGLSRTPVQGDTIAITSSDGNTNVTLEFDETSDQDHLLVDNDRADTADELAAKVIDVLSGQTIAGLNPSELQVVPGEVLSIGGQSGLMITTTGDSLEIIGEPSVSSNSTLEVFGNLLLTIPAIGGSLITPGSVLTVVDNFGNDVYFEFILGGTSTSIPGAVPVEYQTFQVGTTIAANLVTAINGANTGLTATDAGSGRVSFGKVESTRVSTDDVPNPNDPLGGVFPGVNATVSRALVADGETLTIRQGTTSVTFEFEASFNGGGVQEDNVQVVFSPGSSPGDVAASLAAAINNNKGNLDISAMADGTSGRVELDDVPGTVIDISQAPTLRLSGVPGGAIPVFISPAFGPSEIKQAFIDAINSVNQPGEESLTTLSAVDRGGATFFVSGGASYSDLLRNFALPAISDIPGNPLEANRNDLTTQFTILLPTVGLDYGDAPDPVSQVPGRYPTTLANDGPRHVADGDLTLGRYVDIDFDGTPSVPANGDDIGIAVSDTGTLFATSVVSGNVRIEIESIDASTRDGDTITIDTSVGSATLELDVDGLFDEDNFAIRPADLTSNDSIAAAIAAAISESGLRVAGVEVDGGVVSVIGDDEDGVNLISSSNPTGILNAGLALPIDVTVDGAGVLEAWIDFNADGDLTDPGEQIIPMIDNDTFNNLRDQLCPANLAQITSNIFADTGQPVTRTFCIVVPPTTPIPTQELLTYGRFRVSREGGLQPNGLALSGEVEDYLMRILPGTPPTIANSQLTYSVNEDQPLNAIDATGSMTSSLNDNGVLASVVDPDGDQVQIFPADVGTRELMTPDGTAAGTLSVQQNGTFTFVPVDDFSGTVQFSVRVTDVQPLDPTAGLTNSTPITVTINVLPVNDPPFATSSQMTITREIDEDEVQIFNVSELVGDMYLPGPPSESDQPLIIQSAGTSTTPFRTTLGGTLSILNGGLDVQYTPPADYNGIVPDTFTYVVADFPGAGQVSQAASQPGSVSISFRAVNDAPRPVVDTYLSQEGVPLSIAINGSAGDPGILDNDLPGPADEVAQNQTISLVAGQFPKSTDNGGTVTLSGGRLIYTPRAFFSGTDRFTYDIIDNLGATGTGEVFITVGDVDNSPEFLGINGDPSNTSITRDESKSVPQQQVYDLETWFSDPDNDDLTFEVTSSNSQVADVTLTGSTLVVEYPPYGFGTAMLTVIARDGTSAPAQANIPVTVNNTPDPPQVIGTLNPLSANEDEVVTANLGSVFSDPDGQVLAYQVARIGTTLNPTPAQIAQHPLLQSISTSGGQLVIQLDPDQSGSVEIEISASDGTFTVSDTFTLTVAPSPDAPVAVADGYNVPIGSSLVITNPADGLLRNDSDADGQTITVDVATATSTSRGTLQLNADGTLSYTNTSGTPGQTDSFTYRVLDSGGTPSQPVTVTFTLNNSRYQNPLTDLSWDVNADGVVSAIDALRIVNFLGRRGGDVPVAEIGAPPPDFLDVNGDGVVTSLDSLNVVNRLRVIDNSSEQLIAEGEPLGPWAASAATSSLVSAATPGLPVRNIEPVPVDGNIDSRQRVLAAGIEITSGVEAKAIDSLAADPVKRPLTSDIDEVFADFVGDFEDEYGLE